jgi:hypothetical protein
MGVIAQTETVTLPSSCVIERSLGCWQIVAYIPRADITAELPEDWWP